MMPKCHNHQDKESLGACHLCGRFCCSECLANDEKGIFYICNECSLTEPLRFTPALKVDLQINDMPSNNIRIDRIDHLTEHAMLNGEWDIVYNNIKKQNIVGTLAKFLLFHACEAIGKNQEARSSQKAIEEDSNKEQFLSFSELIVKEYPNNAIPHFLLGSAYFRTERLSDSMQQLKDSLKIKEDLFVATALLGDIYFKQGEYDQAIHYYTQAIKINPRYASRYNNRGMAYRGKGMLDQAIADYNKAIEIDSRYALPYYNRGIAHGKKRMLDQEIDDYTKAIEIDPDYAAAYHNRGAAYCLKGEHDRAIADFNKAIEILPNPDLAESYFSRGGCYYMKGLNKRAAEDWKKAVELDPDGKTGQLARQNISAIDEK